MEAEYHRGLQEDGDLGDSTIHGCHPCELAGCLFISTRPALDEASWLASMGNGGFMKPHPFTRSDEKLTAAMEQVTIFIGVVLDFLYSKG